MNRYQIPDVLARTDKQRYLENFGMSLTIFEYLKLVFSGSDPNTLKVKQGESFHWQMD